MTKKAKDFTQREFLEAIIAGQLDKKAETGQTIQEKALDMLTKIDARNVANKGKKRKSTVDNTEEKISILNFLQKFDESVLAKEIAEHTGLTVQKVAAVLKQLVAEGKVERLDLGRNKPLEYRAMAGAMAETGASPENASEDEEVAEDSEVTE